MHFALIIQNRGGEIMDTKKLLESLDFSKVNIHRQALVYSFSNIFTLSMLSGFGVNYKFSSETTVDFLEKLNNEFNLVSEKEDELQNPLCQDELNLPDEEETGLSIDKDFFFFNDLSPIQAVYSKTTLTQSSDNDFEKRDNFKLEFDSESLEKKLSPKNQGLLIVNEINLSRL